MILSYEQQKEIKEISLNNKKKYEQLNKEVEEYELPKLIGQLMYQNLDTEDNDLYNGCEFEFNGITYKHKGLRYVLAYLCVSAYAVESHINDTFTGYVQKTREDSERISIGELKGYQLRNREIALSAFELTKKYIQANADKYPYFQRQKQQIYRNKIHGISKTLR